MTQTLRELLYAAGTLKEHLCTDYSTLNGIRLEELLAMPRPDPDFIEVLHRRSCRPPQSSLPGAPVGRGVVQIAQELQNPLLDQLLHPREKAECILPGYAGYSGGALQDAVWACSLAATLQSAGIEGKLGKELLALPISALLPAVKRSYGQHRYRPLDRMVIPAIAQLEIPLESMQTWIALQGMPRSLFRGPLDPLDLIVCQLQQARQSLGPEAAKKAEFKLRVTSDPADGGPSVVYSHKSRSDEFFSTETSVRTQLYMRSSALMGIARTRAFASHLLERLPSLPELSKSERLTAELTVAIVEDDPGEVRLELTLKQSADYTMTKLIAELQQDGKPVARKKKRGGVDSSKVSQGSRAVRIS